MRDIHSPGRSIVMGTRGLVATSQPMATQAGLNILRQGGNAMDAAVAASAVLCVTEPQSTGIGGDCFLLYHEARSGELHGLNGSGRAPEQATLGAYRRRGLEHIPERGPLAITVPGAIDAWSMALERFGTLELGEALQQAIEFAEDGYAVSPIVAHFWALNEVDLAQYDDSKQTLLVQGHAPKAGTVHHQPNLAHSLRRIAKGGRDAFYQGPIAAEIARAVKAAGGLLTEADLAHHRGEWVQPIQTVYRGVRLCEIPPNGQGITALMMLNILQGLPIADWQPGGVELVHAMAEAFKLALAEREQHVCDPAFHQIPITALLSEEFATRQQARFNPAAVLPHPLTSGLPDHRDTVYLSVVDGAGNACSFINSLFWSFGSAFVAGSTGITLQNRGGGFVLEAGHFNCLAPRKRPLHTIIPAMAYGREGEILCYGVMGGQYQAMGHAQVLSHWVDHGMDLQEAIDAPRFLPWEGILMVERGIAPETRAGLAKLGHTVREAANPLGGGQAILSDPHSGVLQAASDPRKDGCAIGY